MGRRGRLPDPNSKKSRAALARAKQLEAVTPRADAPAAPAASVKPPASLAADPIAVGFWKRNAPILIADGRLTADRVDAFALLCQLHADASRLAEQVATEGWITATDKGQSASPVAKLLRDSRRDWVTLARDFGLTAAAAARIPQEAPSGEEEGDPDEALLHQLSVRG